MRRFLIAVCSVALADELTTWTAKLDLAGATTVQFKLIKKDSSGKVTWESGANRSLLVPISGASYQATWH